MVIIQTPKNLGVVNKVMEYSVSTVSLSHQIPNTKYSHLMLVS
jgi:hypothetical protein